MNKLLEIGEVFYPKSVAIIGASNNELKIGGFIFSQIKDHPSIKGFPINVKENMIQNKPAYKSVLQITEEIDLAVIVIPKQGVFQALEDCAKKGIKHVVIISAGFKEIGEEGKQDEDKLKTFCKEHGITLVGPNCLGFLNPELKLNLSFAKDLPKFGNVALVSQSGAVIDSIIDWSFTHNIGFSKIISVGNMAGITQHDFLEYLYQDVKTQAIVFYLESLEEGERFKELLSKTTPTKPVFILHPGRSQSAQNAISAHTGSLAHNYELIKTIYKYSNTVLVEGFDQLFGYLSALKSSNNKPPKGKKILIVTNAGGPGVIATDYLEEFGLQRYELSDEEKELFHEMPPASSLNNPVDILGDADPDRYFKALNAAIQTQADGIVVLLTPQMMTNAKAIAQSIIEIEKQTKKPIYCCFLGDKEIKDALKYFDLTQISYFSSPKVALQSYATLEKYYSSKPLSHEIEVNHEKIQTIDHQGLLPQDQTIKIIKSLGLKTPKTYLLKSHHDIYTTQFDEHLVYFVKADNILHKKDVGAIRPHVQFDELIPTLEEMFTTFSKENNEGLEPVIIVQEEVKGIEVIAGLKCDESLGNFLLFGSGGTTVSIFKDVQFSPTPMNREMSEKCVESTLVNQLLDGYRGDEAVNKEELYTAIERISELPSMYPNLKEVDCNPIIVNKKGAYLVDVKLLFQ